MRDEETNLKLLADDALADRIRFYDMQPPGAETRRHLAAALIERGKRPSFQVRATHTGDKPWN